MNNNDILYYKRINNYSIPNANDVLKIINPSDYRESNQRLYNIESSDGSDKDKKEGFIKIAYMNNELYFIIYRSFYDYNKYFNEDITTL